MFASNRSDVTTVEEMVAAMENKQRLKRMNLNVPIELHNAFKSTTAAQGQNMTDVLLEFIQTHVEKNSSTNIPMHSIVFATDFLESSRLALDYAVALSKRVNSHGARSVTAFPAASVATTSMLNSPSRTRGSVALRSANGFCAADGSRKGRVCPPAPQVPRMNMPAIKAARCGLRRFTTIPRVPLTRAEHSMEGVRSALASIANDPAGVNIKRHLSHGQLRLITESGDKLNELP